MVYAIDILIFINIAFMQPDLSPELTAVLFFAHIVVLMIAELINWHKDRKIEKLENTIEDHLRWHRQED